MHKIVVNLLIVFFMINFVSAKGYSVEKENQGILVEIYNLGKPPGYIVNQSFEPMNVDVIVLKYFHLGMNKQQIMDELEKSDFEIILDEEQLRTDAKKFIARGNKANYEEGNRIEARYSWGKIWLTPDPRALRITFYFSDEDQLINIKSRYWKPQ